MSLARLVLNTLWQFVLSPIKATDVMPEAGNDITIAIWVIAVALLVYVWKLRGRNILR